MANTGIGELIRAILRLDASIARQQSAKQQVEVKIELTDQLRAAATPGAKVSVLGKYAGTGAYAGREREVARNLSAYRRNKTAYETLRASRDRLQQRLDVLRRKHSAMPPGSRAPGGYNFRKAAEIKDRIRITQQARKDALLAMRGHRRQAMAAVGGATSAAIGGGASLALSAARLSTAVTALTSAYKVGQAVIGAAEANLHRYGGYSAGGMQAQLYDRLGDFTRNIYTSHKTSESMLEFAKANTRLKDSFADLNVWIINLVNKLAAGLANTVGGTVDAISGKTASALTLEERKAMAEKAFPGITKEQEKLNADLNNAKDDKRAAENAVAIAENNLAKTRMMRHQNAANDKDVADAEAEVAQAKKEQAMVEKKVTDAANKKAEVDKKIADVASKELEIRKKNHEDELKKFRDRHMNAFQSQISDMPKFGRKAVDLDDPRVARMAADYLRRARAGALPMAARRGNFRRVPGGGVRGRPFRPRAAGGKGAAPAAGGGGFNPPFGRAPLPANNAVPEAVRKAFAGMSNQQLRDRRQAAAAKAVQMEAQRKKAIQQEQEAIKKAGENAANDPVREAASEKRRAIEKDIQSYQGVVRDINAELRRRTSTGRAPGTAWMQPTPSRMDPTAGRMVV